MSQGVEELVDLLMLPAWGRWARPRIDKEMGYKPPGWASAVKSGYSERPSNSLPVIPDDYAEMLDAEITSIEAGLQKEVLFHMYIGGLPKYQAARKLGISRDRVVQERDAAVWYLCGRLIDQKDRMKRLRKTA